MILFIGLPLSIISCNLNDYNLVRLHVNTRSPYIHIILTSNEEKGLKYHLQLTYILSFALYYHSKDDSCSVKT